MTKDKDMGRTVDADGKVINMAGDAPISPDVSPDSDPDTIYVQLMDEPATEGTGI